MSSIINNRNDQLHNLSFIRYIQLVWEVPNLWIMPLTTMKKGADIIRNNLLRNDT